MKNIDELLKCKADADQIKDDIQIIISRIESFDSTYREQRLLGECVKEGMMDDEFLNQIVGRAKELDSLKNLFDYASESMLTMIKLFSAVETQLRDDKIKELYL